MSTIFRDDHILTDLGRDDWLVGGALEPGCCITIRGNWHAYNA
jgi:hypothetical protein